MTTAVAYDNGRQRQRPTTTAVGAYNDGRRRQQPTTIVAAAYINLSRGGGCREGRGAYARAGVG